MIRYFSSVSVLVCYILNSGCATIINGSTEKIEIFSSSEATNVYVNEVFVGIANVDQALTIEVAKKGRIEIAGKKENCSDDFFVLRRTIDPTTFLGFLIDGGIISILVVDIIGTNAFVKAEQNNYLLEPKCTVLR